MNDREKFEDLFPVPDNVHYSTGAKAYLATSNYAELHALRYNYLWKGYEAGLKHTREKELSDE